LRPGQSREERFWVGTKHHLWHNWQDDIYGDWSGPADLGGFLNNCISGTANAGGQLEIFAHGAGGDLEHIWQLGVNEASTTLLHYKWQQAPNCCWTPDWH
jgi:hypothetical protein